MDNKILGLLQTFESSPGAVSLVAAVCGVELDYEPYEASEGYNDSKVEELLKNATTEQKLELTVELLQAAAENID